MSDKDASARRLDSRDTRQAPGYPVDRLLPNSRLQAIKALLEMARAMPARRPDSRDKH